MSTPIERASCLIIGSVDFVSPNEVKVVLDLDAPQATALNSGTPNPFPRINGYVLIPNETGAVVGVIGWVGVEHSAFPERTGMKDFGLIDLPYPLRKMSLTPVGTLVSSRPTHDRQHAYKLERGVFVFPSVGDSVYLPTAEQLRCIVESSGSDARVPIGRAPLAAHAVVSVDPDKLFGRHLAVLGNTGSGKSCTMAGLIRWSVQQAKRCTVDGVSGSTARFIVLDPNGEYHSAFSDLGCTVLRVSPKDDESLPLTVPAWMWNGHEWAVLTNASPGAQRPLLIQALRQLRAGIRAELPPVELRAARRLRNCRLHLAARLHDRKYTDFNDKKNLISELRAFSKDSDAYAREISGEMVTKLDVLSQALAKLADEHEVHKPNSTWIDYPAFAEVDLHGLLQQFDDALKGLPAEPSPSGVSEDTPSFFDVSALPDHIEQLADLQSGPAFQHSASLVLRIRTLLSDERMKSVVQPTTADSLTFEAWLKRLLDGGSEGRPITIVDLSLVPSDIVHVLVSVLARIIFETLQRHRNIFGCELPTVLVLEEAHNFIRRGGQDANDDGPMSPTALCRQTFERIAREGRKFGLGLVLSSQRPDELSPTVLGQCNTFILHRIVNDRDQQLVARLVPDNLGGLLRELPSLPSRQAVLLGSAAPIPVLVDIDELTFTQCPKSADPKFWDTWTGVRPVNPDWNRLKDEWSHQ